MRKSDKTVLVTLSIIAVLALVLVLALLFASCQKETPAPPPETTAETTAVPTEPPTEATTEETTEPTTEATEEITEPQETEPEPTEPEGVPGIIVNASVVNVREAAGTNQKKVCQLAQGTTVTVYEIVTVAGKDWGRIDQGWVCMDYVKLSGTLPDKEPEQTKATEPTLETSAPTEPTKPDHVHTYTSKVTKPTCTVDGYTLYTCTCGTSYTDNIVQAVGHKFGEWVTTKKPSTTAEGVAERKCSVCGVKETKTLPKEVANHTHSYTSKVTKAATCQADGVMTYSCSCGATYTETIAKTPHSYRDTVVKATCTSNGYTSHVCTVCGSSYTDRTTPATGHKYKDTVVKPTCTANGYTSHTCSVCQHSYTDNSTPAVGHKFGEWKVTVQPTETSTGLKERTCSVCGKKETQVIDKLSGHVCNFVKDKEVAPTCKADGYFETHCSICGKEGAHASSGRPALNHNWVVTDSKPATCTENGYTVKTCSLCGEVNTTDIKGGHNWVHYHKDATGHYTSSKFHCACGQTFSSYGDWLAHANAILDSTGSNEGHSYHTSEDGWVEDTPAEDYDYCTICNARK